MRFHIYIYMFIIFGCTKSADSTENSNITFLERFDKTSWIVTIPFDGEDSNGNGYDDRDFNRDGIEDKLIYSFLNTSNLYDIYFYRDISNGATFDDLDVMEGFCANVGYPPAWRSCGGVNYDTNTYELIKHTPYKLELKKTFWTCDDTRVVMSDFDGNGIQDYNSYEFTYNPLKNEIIRKFNSDLNSTGTTQVFSEIDLTWRENYNRCGYVHRRFRGRY